MKLTNSKTSWGAISKSLHWLVALLILVAIVLGISAVWLPLSPAKLNLFVYHKSIGISVLVLVMLRVLWKIFSPQPMPADGLTQRQSRLANAGHWLLYGLMFAVPISGWLLNSAANIPFKWMHLFSVPMIPGVEKEWQDPATLAHQLLFISIALAATGHATMALYHHYIHSSNVLTRMLPRGSKLLWIYILTLGLFAFSWIIYDVFSVSTSTSSSTAEPANSLNDNTIIQQDYHTRQQWFVVEDKSKLAFTGRYDGVEFKGEFADFEAKLFFDSKEPQLGFFDVSIDTASVTTYTADWDINLPEEDWFSTAIYPQAFYKTSAMLSNDEGFTAKGLLSLKGVSKPVDLDFSWRARPDGSVDFEAETIVKRTDFNIGEGLWAEDPSIGLDVKVHITLLLSPSR